MAPAAGMVASRALLPSGSLAVRRQTSWTTVPADKSASEPSVTRIAGSTLAGSTAEFDRIVRQPRVPVLIEGLTEQWAAHERWATRERLVLRHGDVEISLRDNSAVARSGGAFHSSHRLSLRDFTSSLAAHDANGGGSGSGGGGGGWHTMLFSTARDECWQRLSADYEIPSALADAVAQPIVSIGGAGGGLAFHQHEENWLALVTGRKRWLLAPPTAASPATAHRRVAEGEQPPHPGTIVVDQQPGEILYLPPGWWHCTYNAPADLGELTVAVSTPSDFGLACVSAHRAHAMPFKW
eukprot:COSAG02_NODE_3564_length_6552_cov_5.292112_4_plen_296_part_00